MQPKDSSAPAIDRVSAMLVALAQALRVDLVVWSNRLRLSGDDVTVKRLTPLIRAHEAGVRQCVTLLAEWGAEQARHQYDRVIYFDVAREAWICRARAVAIEAAFQEEYVVGDLAVRARATAAVVRNAA